MERDDPLVAFTDKATEQFSVACLPGAFLVDVLPIRTCSPIFTRSHDKLTFFTFPVKYVPEWFPGAGFKKTAKQWLATVNELAEKPYLMVKDEMVMFPLCLPLDNELKCEGDESSRNCAEIIHLDVAGRQEPDKRARAHHQVVRSFVVQR
jgi:hypothetical protein